MSAVRASQVVIQVLESYSNPTNVRASQAVIQVLRTAVNGVTDAVVESISLADTRDATTTTANHVSISESMSLSDARGASLAANGIVNESMSFSDGEDAAIPVPAPPPVITHPLVLRGDYLYEGMRIAFDPADALARLDVNLDKLRKIKG